MKVVVLTTCIDDRSVVEAMRVGARGFLTKDAGAEEIQRAIASVTSGGAAIEPAVQHHHLVDAVAAAPPAAGPAGRGAGPALPDA
jgi:DNA-binding NarL/FixJ family response regulator